MKQHTAYFFLSFLCVLAIVVMLVSCGRKKDYSKGITVSVVCGGDSVAVENSIGNIFVRGTAGYIDSVTGNMVIKFNSCDCGGATDTTNYIKVSEGDLSWATGGGSGTVRPAREDGYYERGDIKFGGALQDNIFIPAFEHSKDTIYIYRDTCSLRGVSNGGTTVLYIDDNGLFQRPLDTIVYKQKNKNKQ